MEYQNGNIICKVRDTCQRFQRETTAADTNTVIICRKMLTKAIERIRFLMDKIEGKKEISDLFRDWDKEAEEVKSEKKW